jgi:signal transduction histidine kinase/CheY-like chemotaxis protein
VNIHAGLAGGEMRLVGLVGAALLAGCNLAPGPDIQRLTEGASKGGQVITLPHDWPVRSFVQGTTVSIPFSAVGRSDSFGVYIGPTTLTFRATVNDRFVHESGDASSPGINYGSYRARPHFRIPAELIRPAENVLTLQLFLPQGTTYAQLGRIYVGDDESVEALALRRLLAFHIGPLAIGIMLLAVGLVAMGLWRGRRDSELFMLLAIGSLLWASQILLFQWPTRLLPSPHWSVFVNSMYAWFPALIGVFFLRFAYRRSRTLEWFAIALAIVVAPLMYAGFLWGFAEAAFIGLRLGVLIFISLALVAVLRYALQLRTWTGYTLFAMGAVCVGVAIRDFVRSLSPDSYDELILNPYSGVALLLFAGWMLLERYHKAYADFEMLNRDLEYRVAAANVELHRRLEQMEVARATAEQASVAKSRFFAAASHDLRQPLHSLGLFATALRDVVGNAEGRDLVRRIGDSIAALNRLFDELLDISRLEAGTVEVRRRDIKLQPLFDRLADEFSAEAMEQGLRLRFHPTALAVSTDPTLLERVLANLVSNAIRYTRVGGVLIGARRRGRSVELQIWDTGIGIPLEQRSKIFEEFYQVANPARDPRQGLGLGLAIVRRLTALLDIPIDFQSVAGQGTCFTLQLPRVEGPIAPEPAEEPPEFDSRFEGRRALVVDDDAAICEATVRLLGHWGFETRAAPHFAQACELINEGFVPDVILADLRLAEDIDGIRTVDRLRERLRRTVPALLISGDTGARELARVRESGLLLLTKPVAPARLRSALHALLAAQPN